MYVDKMSIGDKLIYWSANKGVIKDIIPKGLEPYTDFRPDEEIKKEIYFNKIINNYNILFVLDDRAKVVKMWRELKLTCLQVDDGDF